MCFRDSLLLVHHQVLSNSETPWTAARQASLSRTISQSLPKFMSTGTGCPASHPGLPLTSCVTLVAYLGVKVRLPLLLKKGSVVK